MALDPESPREYLVGHIEDALARDPRVLEQGLHAAVVGDTPTVVVSGTVADSRHKPAIVEVIAEVLPGARVRDETVPADYPESAAAEELP